MHWQIAHSIQSIASSDWSQLQGADTPFTRYEFHLSLEKSGCVDVVTDANAVQKTTSAGWHPLHLLLMQDNQLMAIVPAYLKMHSWGEYVFDHAWAQAYQHYGLDYYPKLISAAPFTPCAGPRLLLAEGVTNSQVIDCLQTHLPAIAEQHKLHSWHWLFAQQADWSVAESSIWHRRDGCQFHWRNEDYTSFDHFLKRLSSRKRKNINKERRQIANTGIDFDWLHSHEITPPELHGFYQCYTNTYLVRGRKPYLNLDFFKQVLKHMGEQVMLVKAQRDGRALAYAWNFIHQDTLYGRYWGCLEEVPLLHFETCYYQGMDYCIANDMTHFDAGAQGEHKLTRGFSPKPTRSYHWLAEQGFHPAIEQFCNEEAKHIRAYMAWAQQQTPYKDVTD